MGIFNNLSLTNKVIKLTIVNSLIVRNSNLKKLTTFSNNKMVCNKITFVFVLVGLISISCMVSSAALGDDTTEGTTAAPTTQKATTQKSHNPKSHNRFSRSIGHHTKSNNRFSRSIGHHTKSY